MNVATLTCPVCNGTTRRSAPNSDTGTPCRHEFVGQDAGRCYTVYTCKHCPERYDIDSSD